MDYPKIAFSKHYNILDSYRQIMRKYFPNDIINCIFQYFIFSNIEYLPYKVKDLEANRINLYGQFIADLDSKDKTYQPITISIYNVDLVRYSNGSVEKDDYNGCASIKYFDKTVGRYTTRKKFEYLSLKGTNYLLLEQTPKDGWQDRYYFSSNYKESYEGLYCHYAFQLEKVDFYKKTL